MEKLDPLAIVREAESSGGTVTHYGLACGVTVRISDTNPVYVCLTCHSTTCKHARAVVSQLTVARASAAQ